MLEKPICPYCKTKQKKPFKSWKYGRIKVIRYKCDCRQLFNFYISPKSTWSIPKIEQNRTVLIQENETNPSNQKSTSQ